MQREAADVIVVGSGAAGLTAACVAAAEGASVVLLESTDLIGGTTAISGGMVWVPVNHKMEAHGKADNVSQAIRYLSATVPDLDIDLARQYIASGDEAIRYLERHTLLRLRPVTVYPDYYPSLPGATDGGRVLEPVPVDGRVLGAHFRTLRPPLKEFMLFGGMMISREDIPHLRRVGKSLRSTSYALGLMARYVRQRMAAHRGTSLYLGNALAARLYKSVLDRGIAVRLNTTAVRLLTNETRVTGVEYRHKGGSGMIQAQKGVILATGGLSHDAALRSLYVPPIAGSRTATIGSADVVSGAGLARQVDAALTPPASGGAFWVPVSEFTRRDGTTGMFPHTVTDRSKPGLIAVNQEGKRFVNEALSYHEFVSAQLLEENRASTAWLVADRRFLWKYGLGCVRPFSLSVSEYVASGYLHKGRSIAELAGSIGVPVEALVQTVQHYNKHAQRGEDPLFHRGADQYQRHLGDAEQQPNPCVAPIDKGPYYAVAVHPADLGMAAGVMTNPMGNVLSEDGQAIPGLYACGNDRHSMMNGAYPGPGITLGPAVTFAYLAAQHCLEAGC